MRDHATGLGQDIVGVVVGGRGRIAHERDEAHRLAGVVGEWYQQRIRQSLEEFALHGEMKERSQNSKDARDRVAFRPHLNLRKPAQFPQRQCCPELKIAVPLWVLQRP